MAKEKTKGLQRVQLASARQQQEEQRVTLRSQRAQFDELYKVQEFAGTWAPTVSQPLSGR